ncbi:TonB-dependent receptor plug domain-containing protein [Gimibacter soli]|uniref:TonB-dependent receptor n=1 Tax=Gimibacter soli TaxID=3024400 RepID=A0AAE9XN79_9PROT|nr:TonB-dependent receptor [Gimibacter soli]WCL53276.1 TonB-dependent receptor [Gimibacter soli]
MLASCVLVPTLVIPQAWAAETSGSRLEEISVLAVRSENRALQPAVQLDEELFRRTVPTDFTEVFRAVMGVGVRTNSRGEAVLRLRGSEERQTQLFIDGAPISVPWDGRADLSLFPASLIRRATVIKSAAPIEYGANAVLGVVDISTFATGDDFTLSARSEAGTHGSYLVEGETYVPVGNVGLQFGGNHFSRDAISVAGSEAIPFDPLLGDGRTNTDLTSTSFFGAVALEETWGTLRLSAIDIDADKGIAAAAHLDPAESSPRFWRYPDWHMRQISLAGDIRLGESSNLRVNTWHQRFSQAIVSYRDITYSVPEDRQNDKDRTYGGRLVLATDWSHLTTRLVTSLQQSTHAQFETDLSSNVDGDTERFRQRLFSIGGEVDVPMGEAVKTSLALAYDRASTPLTGGRPTQPAISKWAASGATQWLASDELTITATLGLRTRFPTMRELYGTALGRFLLNPDLKPETALVGDLSFEWAPQALPFQLSLTPWFTRISDTLSQRRVTVDDASLTQRYNLEGSRGYGIEAGAIWQVSEALTLEANALWQDLEADRDEDGNRPILYQRPRGQLLLAANHTFAGGANLRVEANHTGHAYDEAEDGTTARLEGSTELNVKFYIPVKETSFGVWQLYGALNNITDALVLPQLGLPEAGRAFKVGIRFSGD